MAWVHQDFKRTRDDGSVPFVVGWRDATGRLCQKTFRDERRADKFCALQDADEQRRSQGDYLGGRQTFEQAAKAWLDAPRKRALKPRVRSEYERLLLGVGNPAKGPRNVDKAKVDYFKALRSKRVDQITPQHLEQIVKKLIAAGKTPNTVRNVTAPARSTFSYAVKQRWIPVNPMSAVTLPEERPDGTEEFEPVFLSAAEVELLATQLDKQHPDGLIVRLLAGTGLRVAELAGLRVRDVNLLRRSVTVERTLSRMGGEWVVGTPKSRRSRRQVPLWDDALLAALSAYITQEHPHADDPDALLFCGRQVGGDRKRDVPLKWSEPWNGDAFLSWRFRPALKATKLPTKTRLHDLRHTCAMRWIDDDYEIAKVSKWLGHGDSSITERIYTRAPREEDFAAELSRRRQNTQEVVQLRLERR